MNILFEKLSDAMCFPTLIQIEKNLIVASFTLMKLLPAKFVIEKAIREKHLTKESSVVETSSGTYALGLGIVCREQGIPYHIVSDPVIDQNLRQQLEYLGGSVQIVEDPINGHQVARLNALKGYLKANPTAFWPRQYDNPDHLLAYHPFANQLIAEIGKEFTFIASVGSGSSSSGTIMKLRSHNPNIDLIGVDTFGSILFGLPNGKRLLRGLGNSILPANLNHSYFDQIHWLSAAQAFRSTRELYSKTALYSGATTGACYQVAKWLAENNPRRKFVFISADLGHRYSTELYNDKWMCEKGCLNEPIVKEPIKIIDQRELDGQNVTWACMNWNRRHL